MEHSVLSFIAGGFIFGATAFFLLYTTDKVFGVSGFVDACLYPYATGSNSEWKAFFLLGLLAGGIILKFFYPIALDIHLDRSLYFVFLGGCLVGCGSRLGGGCTSGHGLSGMGRLRPPSIIATMIFVCVGIATATILGKF